MIVRKFLIGLTVVSLYLLGSAKYAGASKKYNRYLAHLFNKYGTGGTMTFEGLEHLMYNLGLGEIEFGPKHTIEEHHPNGYKIPELDIDDYDLNGIYSLDDLKKGSYLDPQNNKHEDDNISVQTRNRTTQASDNQKQKEVNATTFEVKNDTISGNISSKVDRNSQESDIIVDDDTFDLEVQDNKSDTSGKSDSNQPFIVMHDPKHRHPRHHDDHHLPGPNRCLSPLSLMKLVIDPERHGFTGYVSNQQRHRRHAERITGTTSSTEDSEEENLYTSAEITPAIFMKICPALLVQIDQDACAQKTNHLSMEEENRPGSHITWIYATISIFIISCCGLFGVAIVPLMKSIAYQEILKFLVAVAVGTLCGDAFMHLLPHALHSDHNGGSSTGEHSDHNEPIFICGCAFASAILMYTLETLLPLIKGSPDNHHGHSHNYFQTEVPFKETNMDMELDKEMATTESKQKELNIMLDEDQLDKKEQTSLSPVAFMVILGDGLHNLTDGLAIGAAFANDPVTGMATAFAVLCHELPHELGDFALLIKTGVHINRAIILNIASSILSFIGMIIGIVLAEWQAGIVRWIYAGTAGSFLYIALTDLIPEMGRGGKHDLKNCLIQIFGICIGGLIMLFIALYEGQLRKLFQ